MKKTLLLVLLTTLTLISCQKESDVLPNGNNANYFVENGILNVKNQSVLDSLVAANFEKSEEEVVAWSDSLGFKSLASVYKDAEKEKDVLTLEELKAKYEGKLVFNTDKGAENEFTCDVTDIRMASLMNESRELIVNNEHLTVAYYISKTLLKTAPNWQQRGQDGKRRIYVDYYFFNNILFFHLISEKKYLGSWHQYSTDWTIREYFIQGGSRLYNAYNAPGEWRWGTPGVRGNKYVVWSGGVREQYGVTLTTE